MKAVRVRALSRPELVVLFFVVLGCALRLRQYAFRRSLWLDEAMLAVSIAARSPIELLKPLEYNQNAPILFLWIAKACAVVFGVNEWALRALPQISGCLLLIVLAVLTKRVFGTAASIACASVAALSPTLVRYANEAKPYGVDALVTGILLLAFAMHSRALDRRGALVLSAVGSLSVLLSHPAVFTATSVWLALAWTNRSDKAALSRVATSGAVWIFIFAASYLLIVRPAAANELVRAGYHTAFLPPYAESADLMPLMISGTFFPAFGGDAIPELTGAQSILMSGGFVAVLAVVARTQGVALAIALGGPVALCFAAASLGLYPVGVPRLMMFQVPCVLVAVAGLVSSLWPKDADVRLERLGFGVWLLILWPMWADAWRSWVSPFPGDDFRGAYNEYESLQHGEPVYIGAKAQPAWLFYSTNWTPETQQQKERFDQRLRFYFDAGGKGPAFENRASRGGPIAKDEGRELVFDFEGRPEILGIATGRQWKWPTYVSPVDEGWPEHEAARVRAAVDAGGHTCEWIVFERVSELAYRPLRNALRFDNAVRTQKELSYSGVTIGKICRAD